mmetsp:Transcript_23082/g.52065  ORF Transcript_23082/g.52065 Transcript_23082/m.52065 type:complete len:126 (+) Transcript_23082:271-648(+)
MGTSTSLSSRRAEVDSYASAQHSEAIPAPPNTQREAKIDIGPRHFPETCVSSSRRLDQAVEKAKQGDASEAKGNLAGAVQLRTQAVELLIEEMKRSEPNSERKRILYEETSKLLTKTEKNEREAA